MCASAKYSLGWVSTITMSWVALASMSLCNSSQVISGYRLSLFGSAPPCCTLETSEPQAITQMKSDERAITFLALMSFSFFPGQTAIVASRDRRCAIGREHNPRFRERRRRIERRSSRFLCQPTRRAPPETGGGMRFAIGLHVLLVDDELLERTISRLFHECIPSGGQLDLLDGPAPTTSQNLRLVSTRISADENANPITRDGWSRCDVFPSRSSRIPGRQFPFRCARIIELPLELPVERTKYPAVRPVDL